MLGCDAAASRWEHERLPGQCVMRSSVSVRRFGRHVRGATGGGRAAPAGRGLRSEDGGRVYGSAGAGGCQPAHVHPGDHSPGRAYASYSRPGGPVLGHWRVQPGMRLGHHVSAHRAGMAVSGRSH